MELRSSLLQSKGPMPVRFTRDGENKSPPLEWFAAPDVTQSFVIFCEDMDVPKHGGPGEKFVHWIIYDISPVITSLPAGIPNDPVIQFPVSARQGETSYGTVGYDGPQPPLGESHLYTFTVYALNAKLELPPGADKAAVFTAMRGHVIDSAQLSARYERSAQRDISVAPAP